MSSPRLRSAALLASLLVCGGTALQKCEALSSGENHIEQQCETFANGDVICNTDADFDADADADADANANTSANKSDVIAMNESSSDSVHELSGEVCEDLDEECEEWASVGECIRDPLYMLDMCRFSCKCCVADSSDFGIPQRITNSLEKAAEKESVDYIREIRSSVTSAVVRTCENKNELCTFWKVLGECKKSEGYMNAECAPACQTCHLQHINTRCPVDPNAIDALHPGDLDRLFESVVEPDSDYNVYNPKVLSRPLKDGDDEVPVYGEYIEGPWLVTFDDFVSDEEIDRLLHWGHTLGFRRSTAVGKIREDGTQEINTVQNRTSENSWCNQECLLDPVVNEVANRIARVTNTPLENAEDIQLLRYEPGQFYVPHSDYVPAHKERPCGVRTLTIFLYLNDVEEGGGTHFPLLNITVQPKKGSAALWPSVLNQHPNDMDERTVHGGEPVIKGIKYGANAWVHMRDFQAAVRKDCV